MSDATPDIAGTSCDWCYRVAKRALDVVIAGFLLLLFSPLLVLTALAIKATSPGPALYQWPVVGKNGKPFKAYKFRTMVMGADAMKKKLLDQNEAKGPIFKMKDDPRITPVGRILRQFSLDELPQLWSVLRGDMSMVGPRPVLDYEWEQFNEWQKQKLSVKPGGICLWHLCGQPRNLDEWVKLDLEYIEDWSLWLDLKILAGAIWYVLAGRNY
jgi:lipopolysaccharide/colanic/teichoic acid biosynthesis glycosyltransferase